MDNMVDHLPYVREFESAEDTTRESRAKAQRDRDYYDEKQWTDTDVAALDLRGQPAITFNRIKRKVNAMLGMEKQTRKDPKAFPRNPNDEDSAKAATDVLRYICEDSRWDDKRSQAAKELAIEGTCAIMVGAKKVKAGIDPDIRRISWDRFYFDPASAEFDFADANFMGIVIWMELADAVDKYPDAEDVLNATWEKGRNSDTYDDKPKHGLWSDYKRKRVRLCEHYCLKGGTWHLSIFTEGGFVVPPEPSPYEDEEGQPECPIKAVSLYIDRDNNRYGEVRTMIGPQDVINKSHSKYMHLMSQRQVRVSPNTGLNAIDVRKELARPDGVLMADQGDAEILPTNDMAAANFQINQDAKNEIDLLGPNAAMAGKGTQDQSGRAIMAQQQGGMIELATYLDCIRVLSLAVYRASWCRVRQYWDGPRWIRVTDDERNMRFVGVNQPVTGLQAMAKQMGVNKDNLAEADPQAVQQLQQMAMHPAAQVVVDVENNLAELDVDIIVDEGMDTPMVAAEQFELITKMLPAFGPMGQTPPMLEFIVEASSLRDKGKLLEMLKKMQQAPDPAMVEAQQMQQQLAMAGAQAEVEKTQSETAKNMAQTQQIGAETLTGAYSAGLAA